MFGASGYSLVAMRTVHIDDRLGVEGSCRG